MNAVAGALTVHGGEPAAESFHPLGQTDETAPRHLAVRGAAAVVGNFDIDVVADELKAHIDPRRVGMLHDVGQRFLHDPVDSEIDGRRHSGNLVIEVQRHVEVWAGDVSAQGRNALDADGRRAWGVAVIAQKAEQVVELLQGAAPGGLDGPKRLGDGDRIAVDQAPRRRASP